MQSTPRLRLSTRVGALVPSSTLALDRCLRETGLSAADRLDYLYASGASGPDPAHGHGLAFQRKSSAWRSHSSTNWSACRLRIDSGAAPNPAHSWLPRRHRDIGECPGIQHKNQELLFQCWRAFPFFPLFPSNLPVCGLKQGHTDCGVASKLF